MYQNKLRSLVVGSCLSVSLSGAVYAASGSFDVTFTTIADVTITQITAMNFGNQMFITAGGICNLNAASPTNVSLNQGLGAAAGGTAYGDETGTGCVGGTGTGTPGVYEVAGLAGQNVNITINNLTSSDFNFTPNSGCIINHVTGADNDTCDTFTPGAPQTVRLASATDTGTSGTPVTGRTRMAIGGQVTIGGTNLTANTAYTQQFVITAIY